MAGASISIDRFFSVRVFPRNGAHNNIFLGLTPKIKDLCPNSAFYVKNVKKLMETIENGQLTVGNHWKTLT